jgi:hypothetical protein
MAILTPALRAEALQARRASFAAIDVLLDSLDLDTHDPPLAFFVFMPRAVNGPGMDDPAHVQARTLVPAAHPDSHSQSTGRGDRRCLNG